MKELGEYLKRTRISNGVSLTEACEDLEFSTSHLENIESGNVRAFKDVYELKEDIKVYAKYLGLDSEKVIVVNIFYLTKIILYIAIIYLKIIKLVNKLEADVLRRKKRKMKMKKK